jgi:hypothetical protein
MVSQLGRNSFQVGFPFWTQPPSKYALGVSSVQAELQIVGRWQVGIIPRSFLPRAIPKRGGDPEGALSTAQADDYQGPNAVVPLKHGVLFWREHQVPAALFLRGERGKTSVAHAEIGLAHV